MRATNYSTRAASQPKSHAKKISRPPPAKVARPFTPAQLLVFFLQLLPARALRQLPALQGRRFYKRLFTPLVTLWYLVFQRLHDDHTLDAALADAQNGGANKLNAKLAHQDLSCSTCSYSDARQRLPWDFLLQALQLLGRKITGLSAKSMWKGLVVVLLDGSTARLRPYGDIPKKFTAQRNQHPKKTYWCLMRVVVGFCCFTGAALDCALGSMRRSEQAMGCEIILRVVGSCLFMGDSNFGVFCIVQAARACQQHVLLRLTKARAAKVLGRSLCLGDHQVVWKPSSHDQLQAGLSKDPVPGRLLVARVKRPGFRSQQICLFTTLRDSAQYAAQELVNLYGLRWHIELNLRYVKSQMEAVQLEAHSADMARKEWLATLVAYNLIRAAMLAAALEHQIPPLSLSFCACRRRLECWLSNFGSSQRRVLSRWRKTLLAMSHCQLPSRRHPRPSEPRAQRHLRAAYPPLFGSRAAARKRMKKYASKS